MDTSSALQELATRASRYSINLNGEIKLNQSRGPSRGSTAIVYKGTWAQNGMDVAVKTFYGIPPGDPNLKRILREVHLWSKLRHENVVRMIGISTEFGSTISIVSDWMALGDAHSYVKNEENDPRPLLMDIASGLHYLHSHSLGPVLHGDLKGKCTGVNAIIERYLVTLVLSTFQKSTFSMTVVNPRGGSYPWLAPEFLEDYAPSTAGDVWAFGMVVLVCLYILVLQDVYCSCVGVVYID
ncbi:kinase-like domain-containing protein [Pisolithus marmoratus]|nr:kinase-like domain-containing protein [Pisolithus marmoratus]